MDCRKERKSTNIIPILYLCYAGSGDSRLLAWQFNITNITLSLCQSQINAKLLWWIFSVGCLYYTYILTSGLETATDTVANATNFFSLATKNSSLVAKVATKFLSDLDLN